VRKCEARVSVSAQDVLNALAGDDKPQSVGSLAGLLRAREPDVQEAVEEATVKGWVRPLTAGHGEIPDTRRVTYYRLTDHGKSELSPN